MGGRRGVGLVLRLAIIYLLIILEIVQVTKIIKGNIKDNWNKKDSPVNGTRELIIRQMGRISKLECFKICTRSLNCDL